MSVDFTGRWQADLSHSRLFGSPAKAMRMDIAHAEPELRQEIVVTREDGGEQRVTFTCLTNGEPGQCRFNGQEVRGSAHWQEDELVIELWMQEGPGELYLCDCWSLSPRPADSNDGTPQRHFGRAGRGSASYRVALLVIGALFRVRRRAREVAGLCPDGYSWHLRSDGDLAEGVVLFLVG